MFPHQNYEPLEIKCNFQRPSSSELFLKRGTLTNHNVDLSHIDVQQILGKLFIITLRSSSVLATLPGFILLTNA